ncbi:MAG: cytochrome c oxidase subunit II [Caulobacteraceae bacterium]|nr:cytochrome c oxidase subunit II [Caulobacteraceae bacterium]
MAALAAGISVQARAADIVGQPVDGAMGLQPGYSSLKHEAIFFHDKVLLPIITAITLFVLLLLMICVVKFNRRANPTPAKWSHNTKIEIVWTLVPILILMVIAIFSFRLLFSYHNMPTPDLTVKATGYQWYWGYTYPDQKIDEFTSNVLTKEDATAKGEPYLLAADHSMVVPVNKVVHVLVTGADVIHDFALPAFGIKIDAVPGRVNEAWFKAEKTGIYYGQCDQLCGVNHAFMPIEIKVVTQPEFNAWVASQHAPAAPAAAPTKTASADIAAPQKVALNTTAPVATH